MMGLSGDAERTFHNSIRRRSSNDISFVCTVDYKTKDIVRLRDYTLPDESNIPATIYQAALATSAATTFFEPAIIGNRTFADGGLGANNPVNEVEGEKNKRLSGKFY
jgi:predicted acylesterase/phospholipase RssA